MVGWRSIWMWCLLADPRVFLDPCFFTCLPSNFGISEFRYFGISEFRYFGISEFRNFGISEFWNELQFHYFIYSFIYSIQCETLADRRTCHVLTALSVSSEKYSDSKSSSPQWNPNSLNASWTCWQALGCIRWCNRLEGHDKNVWVQTDSYWRIHMNTLHMDIMYTHACTCMHLHTHGFI